MKKLRYIIAGLGATVVIVPLVVQAEGILDAERLSAIQERCTVLQTTLDQLQRRDLVARTNRGREYENVNKQVDALTERLRHNNIPATMLNKPLADFKAAVTSFRAAYVVYDDSMSTLIRIDCNRNTTDFAQELEKARVLRASVGVEVTKAEIALDKYRQAIVVLQTTVPAPVEGVAQ